MQVKSFAECSERAFCNAFNLHYAAICIKGLWCLFLSGRMRQVLLCFVYRPPRSTWGGTYTITKVSSASTMPMLLMVSGWSLVWWTVSWSNIRIPLPTSSSTRECFVVIESQRHWMIQISGVLRYFYCFTYIHNNTDFLLCEYVFMLILHVPVSILSCHELFLYSWVEPILSSGFRVLLNDITQWLW